MTTFCCSSTCSSCCSSDRALSAGATATPKYTAAYSSPPIMSTQRVLYCTVQYSTVLIQRNSTVLYSGELRTAHICCSSPPCGRTRGARRQKRIFHSFPIVHDVCQPPARSLTLDMTCTLQFSAHLYGTYNYSTIIHRLPQRYMCDT
jgi:hypothetical protein